MTSEKKLIERESAEIFLRLYNHIQAADFHVDSLGEAPDITCVDKNADRVLYLEISLLEDLPGEVAHVLGRGPKPTSPTTGTSVVSLFEDVAPNFRRRLQDKLLASYGRDTALVLRQVSPLWESLEWEIMAPRFRGEILKGKERNYGAGVWVICTDASTWPASDALFCLSPGTPDTSIPAA